MRKKKRIVFLIHVGKFKMMLVYLFFNHVVTHGQLTNFLIPVATLRGEARAGQVK